MIGIVFATKKEAKPFLECINAILICEEPILLFKSSKVEILPCIVAISGIGKVAAAIATTELIIKYKVKLIINAGICGKLKQNSFSDIGSLYRISSSFEGDRELNSVKDIEVFGCISFFENLKEAILVTNDRSIFNNKLKHKLSLIADLVDMEGAVVARVASIYGINCAIVKGVSDYAGNDDTKIMKLNLQKVSLSISEVILEAILIK